MFYFCCCCYSVLVKASYPSGLPRWLSSKESTSNEGDSGSIPGQEDPLEKEMATHSIILAWSLMGNPMDRGVWRASKSIVLQRVEHDWMSKHRTVSLPKPCLHRTLSSGTHDNLGVTWNALPWKVSIHCSLRMFDFPGFRDTRCSILPHSYFFFKETKNYFRYFKQK